jgi:cytochrome c biogenesis protein CcmG, thiol:disulfide interchange protein DsbE
MKNKVQWAFAGGIAATLSATAIIAANKWGAEMRTVSVGTPMPDFFAHTMSEPPITKHFGDYRGRVVIVNVWATYCVPCRVEMPSLEHLYTSMRSQGLVVVGVSIDDPGQERAIRDFTRQYGLSFEILQEGTGHLEQILDVFGVPATFVIGKDGVIRRKLIGASDWDTPASHAMIARLLAQ